MAVHHHTVLVHAQTVAQSMTTTRDWTYSQRLRQQKCALSPTRCTVYPRHPVLLLTSRP